MSLLNLLEEFIMFEKIRKMKNKKGFTLVELIVVLVILAILAAMLVPALTGYIDKANKEKVIATTRMVVMAAQTEASEKYGLKAAGQLNGGNDITVSYDGTTATAAVDGIDIKAIGKLAEVMDDADVSLMVLRPFLLLSMRRVLLPMLRLFRVVSPAPMMLMVLISTALQTDTFA